MSLAHLATLDGLAMVALGLVIGWLFPWFGSMARRLFFKRPTEVSAQAIQQQPDSEQRPSNRCKGPRPDGEI